MGMCIITFLANAKLFQNALPIYTPISSVWEFSLLYILNSTWYCLAAIIFGNLGGVQWYLNVF